MKLAVLGASGATGKLLVAQALAQGHEVTALVRDPERLVLRHERLRVIPGDLSQPDAVRELLRGAEAVVSCVGVARRTPQSRPSDGLPQLLRLMKEVGVRRYVGLSGGAVTLPGEQKPFGARVMARILRLIAPVAVEDKQNELRMLMESDAEWTLVRPPRLTDEPRTGSYRVSLERMPGIKIARADLAELMLAQVGSVELARKAPYVSA
jgi:putative NADH-flavin reductase